MKNNRIRFARESQIMSRFYSLKQFGKAVGVSHHTVESGETGRTPSKPAQKLIDRIEKSGGYKVTGEIEFVIPEYILLEYQSLFDTLEEAAINLTIEDLANKLLKTHANIFSRVMVNKI